MPASRCDVKTGFGVIARETYSEGKQKYIGGVKRVMAFAQDFVRDK